MSYLSADDLNKANFTALKTIGLKILYNTFALLYFRTELLFFLLICILLLYYEPFRLENI